MRPANRRQTDRAVATRSQAGRRGGFTLVEMMVSVTLVMLMMLMFAEIFGLAQETISKQKGIAANDQKARILTEVLRGDLQSRTFRNVYPFKTEMHVNGTGQPVTNFPILDASGSLSDQAQQIIDERRGYFSFSENDPNSDIDDVLQLTVNVTQGDEGQPGSRIFGKAYSPVTLTNGLPQPQHDGPEYDDGRLGDASGSSPMAEVTYFLRFGNLYRSTLLIRQPYLEGDDRVSDLGNPTPNGFPPSVSNFWAKFDYSAYRDIDGAGGSKVEFHGTNHLSNNPDDNEATPYPFTGLGNLLYLPRTLAAPQMRFGFSITPHGQPVEFATTPNLDSSVGAVAVVGTWPEYREAHGFFGRFTTQECSDGTMTYPGNGFAPFNGPVTATDSNSNGILDQYEAGTRRGVDLMLSSVHGFDIKVWDDILGRYVDLGYGDPADTDPTSPAEPSHVGRNPYTGVFPQFGFYHISRLRTAYKPGTVTPADQFHMDYSGAPTDFGNRYDTWCPNMWIPSNAPVGGVFPPNTDYYRTGRAPYRPLQTNPDPNTAAFNRVHERNVTFGDNILDDDGDGAFFPGDVGDSDAEAPLRAIRITIRYVDTHSGQTRQVTIEQSLID